MGRKIETMKNCKNRIRLGGFTLLGVGLALCGLAQPGGSHGLRKPVIEDTVRLTVYADNWFQLYINGELVAVDPIRFIPHNVVSVDVLPDYPMTIAVMACDNADPITGMEYANTNIGDGGFILKLGDGTVTNHGWKSLVVSRGPVGGDPARPKAEHAPLPDAWYSAGFNDSGWVQATEYSESEVDPKGPYFDYDFSGARFIWGGDLKIDNTVLFRCTVLSPPDGVARPDFSGINDQPMGGGSNRGKRR